MAPNLLENKAFVEQWVASSVAVPSVQRHAHQGFLRYHLRLAA
jgi:hypothetical protein